MKLARLVKPLGILTLAGLGLAMAGFIIEMVEDNTAWPDLFIPLGTLFNVLGVITESPAFFVGGMGCFWVSTQAQPDQIKKNSNHETEQTKLNAIGSLYLVGMALSFVGFPASYASSIRLTLEVLLGLVGAGLNIAGYVIFWTKSIFMTSAATYALAPLYLIVLFFWGASGSVAASYVVVFAGFSLANVYLIDIQELRSSKLKLDDNIMTVAFFFTGTFILSFVAMFMIWRQRKADDEEAPLLHHRH
eukprot:TRINITY_DN16541_c0_g1_i1.p1 TRINITY_DN16541_c0_g1~~TRINITY_DN16541_c0_g1_i1.p1  ORF type:complete len:266 (+),score=63.19 TRINITY_DN16541_c0_g1_i1:60-800(+)